ncbi:hypothetical protein HPP92_015072 [Vanilla planifolia]|uniref:Gnk2-homologous domain-containing protein n=1 Tax=Vanilla planifolia TaxID=51239 RepID=A0A835QL64_VANPL|nr:hypothetical protein HPP92_015072 [Vanilla planifolia]
MLIGKMTVLRRFIVLLVILPLASSQPPHTCITPSTDTNLPSSINVALDSVVKNAPGTGFAEFRNPGGVNAFGRCTGAHVGLSCADCLANAAAIFRGNCGNYETGVVWYNSCMLRYSTEDFFGSWDAQPIYLILPSTQDAQIPIQDAVLQLAQTVSNMAVQSGAKLFAAMDHAFNGLNIRTMAQCTQDLSTSQCQECLGWLRDNIASNCGNKDGCRLFHASCILRYSTGMFFI